MGILNKVEDFAKNRPATFWLLTTAITSIPIISFRGRIKSLLLLQINLPVYVIIGAIILPLIIYTILKLLLRNDFKSGIIKELNALKAQLDQPFDIERSDHLSKVKRTEKYYHYEILECFDDYNNLVEKLKQKQSKTFSELLTIDKRPRVHKNDWVHESDMQVIKSKVIKLIEILKR